MEDGLLKHDELVRLQGSTLESLPGAGIDSEYLCAAYRSSDNALWLGIPPPTAKAAASPGPRAGNATATVLAHFTNRGLPSTGTPKAEIATAVGAVGTGGGVDATEGGSAHKSGERAAVAVLAQLVRLSSPYGSFEGELRSLPWCMDPSYEATSIVLDLLMHHLDVFLKSTAQAALTETPAPTTTAMAAHVVSLCLQVLCINVCTLTNAQVSAQEAGLCGPYVKGGGAKTVAKRAGRKKTRGATSAKAKGAREAGSESLLSTIRDTLFKILRLVPPQNQDLNGDRRDLRPGLELGESSVSASSRLFTQLASLFTPSPVS